MRPDGRELNPRKSRQLLTAEVLGAFSSQRIAIILTAAAFLLAAALYIQGLADLRWYLTVAYLFIPALLLPAYVARTPAERQTGFAVVLYTYPVSQRQYYASRYIQNVLVGLAYVLVTLVFTLPMVYLAGPYWWVHLPAYLLLGAGVIAATSAMGLFVAVILGSHKITTSAFLGFLLSLVTAFAPRMVLMVQSIQPQTASLTLLRLLHLFPTVAAIAALPGSGYPIVAPRWMLLAALPALTLGYFLLGYYAYVGLQGPEGWRVGRLRVSAFALTAVVLMLLPAAAPVHFGQPDAVVIRDQDAKLHVYGTLMFTPVHSSGPQDASGSLTQGGTYSYFLSVQFRRSVEKPMNLTNVSVSLSSDILGLHNASRFLTKNICVPGASSNISSVCGAGGTFVVYPILIPLTVRSTPGLVGSKPVEVFATIHTDQSTFVIAKSDLHVAPSTSVPSRASPFVLAAAVSGLAWLVVWLQRRRR